MAIQMPSPAVSIVGRHNSGKTTLIEKLIQELVARGYDVGSIKHHSHIGFDIDYPGKDSYRHRAAGASDTIIAAPGQLARIQTVEGEVECYELLNQMPGHDIVIVEGYRKSGLPAIEIMRSDNEADSRVAAVFAEGARLGWPLGTDFTQLTRGLREVEEHEGEIPLHDGTVGTEDTTGHFKEHAPDNEDISNKLLTAKTEAIVTDIPEAAEAAKKYGILAFELGDAVGLADFIETRFICPELTVVIQAGGESKRMGRSKATVSFAGQPLIMRMIERLGPVADELIITTNEGPKLEFLKDAYPEYNIKLVPDAFDQRGALLGLYTALDSASNPFVAVIACDMVFASASLVLAEAFEMCRTGVDVVVPANQHGYEPFHAVYRKATCIGPVKEAIARGEKRAQTFFDQVLIYEFGQDCVLEVEPKGRCFINVNTPTELAEMEAFAIEEESRGTCKNKESVGSRACQVLTT